MAIFSADSPYIHSCFNLSTTATSLQRPPLYNGHLSTMATSLQQPPLNNGHLSITAIFLAYSPYSHSCFNFSTMATSLQRPFFLADSPYIHYVVSTSLQRLQRPLSSVPNVTVVGRFNCNLTRFITNEDV